MREILFRAKRINNGKWVEGYYCQKKTGHYEEDGTEIKFVEEIRHLIINNMTGGGYQYAAIDPDTICQYTGLTDRNGERIWENDIVEIYSTNIDGEDGHFIIEWDTETARFILNGDGLTIDFDNVYEYECEVIGNIFDKQEE